MLLMAMLLDDEEPALEMLETQLKNFPNIRVAGKYTTYREFIKAVEENTPDVAFTDIEMPGKSGLEIAEEVKEKSPSTDIVFATAYREYACEAFELEATDYIVKPFKIERLGKVITKIEKHKSNKNSEKSGLVIRMMKSLEVLNDDGEPVRWRSKKVQELMAYLLHNRNQELTTEVIMEDLWSADDNKQRKTFYTTVYHLCLPS